MQEGITRFFEANSQISSADLASLCVDALERDLRRDVLSSFESTGIWPLSEERMLKKILKEKPNPKKLSEEEIIILSEATKTAMDHVDEISILLSEKKDREEAGFNVCKSRFSTRVARLSTSIESITALLYSKELGTIEKYKAKDLQQLCVRLDLDRTKIFKPGGN